MRGDAWSDLRKGLEMLERGKSNEISPLHCEHDELWVMSDPSKYAPEEIEQLDNLGFFVSEDDGCFKSYRFGSA